MRIPGADGDLTAMPGHSPLITTLRPGILTVVSAEGAADYAVTGGFAEINGEGVIVLAERGMPKGELTPDVHAEMMEEARKVVETAPPSLVDAAAKMLADMEALGTHMTL